MQGGVELSESIGVLLPFVLILIGAIAAAVGWLLVAAIAGVVTLVRALFRL